jgi:hypothetical protein
MGTNQQRVIERLADVSGKARTGDYAIAAQSLNEFVILFQEIGKSGFGVKINSRITYSLETMLLMLENKDWVALADIIDYEFIPLWKEAFPS